MEKSSADKSRMVRLPLPGGRVARIPMEVLEGYAVDGLTLGHGLAGQQHDVTAHGVSIDASTGASVWHTDYELNQCDFTDENGYHQSGIYYHCHPLGTEYTEIMPQ